MTKLTKNTTFKTLAHLWLKEKQAVHGKTGENTGEEGVFGV